MQILIFKNGLGESTVYSFSEFITRKLFLEAFFDYLRGQSLLTHIEELSETFQGHANTFDDLSQGHIDLESWEEGYDVITISWEIHGAKVRELPKIETYLTAQHKGIRVAAKSYLEGKPLKCAVCLGRDDEIQIRDVFVS